MTSRFAGTTVLPYNGLGASATGTEAFYQRNGGLSTRRPTAQESRAVHKILWPSCMQAPELVALSDGAVKAGGQLASSVPEGEVFGSFLWKEGQEVKKKVAIETRLLPARREGAVEQAVDLLSRGQPVAFPTDTVYGLGAHALLPLAVERLFAVKRRPRRLAVPLLLANPTAVVDVCIDIPQLAWDLAEHFWPGALSLVLRRAAVVPDAVTCGGTTVAVRVPDHALVREICRRLGAPLAATSANLHGGADPSTATEVLSHLSGRIPLILDGGRCSGGVPSTIVDLTVTPPAILRAGPITADDLSGYLGPPTR